MTGRKARSTAAALEPSLTGNAFLIAILFNAALSSRSIVLHWQIASENFDVDFSNGRAHA
jgi:hypothetical protein